MIGLSARVPMAFGSMSAVTIRRMTAAATNPGFIIDKPEFYVTFKELGPKAGCLAKITMNSPKANTFTYASLQALGDCLAEVEAQKGVRGLVLDSTVDGFFSGGFNLPIFQKISQEDFMQLWSLGKHIFRRIYSLPVPSVAAIDGHALGLGCVMAMACQQRYMVIGAKKLIGLNEVAVGMPLPEWLAVRFRDLTSMRTAEDLLASGTAITAPRAHQIGLIDEVFTSKDEMNAAAMDFLWERAAIPYYAQSETLKNLRRGFLDYFDAEFERDNAQFWIAMSHPSTQQCIDRAIAQLAAKSKAKK